MGEHGKIQANRMLLKKAESIVLCCLWTMYADRVRSGSLSQNIQISITELRFELEKYGIKEQFDNKTFMGDILTLFTKFNLVDVHGKLGEPDCMIRLYPSLQFALDTEEFRKFAETTQNRMMERTGEETEDEGEDGDE